MPDDLTSIQLSQSTIAALELQLAEAYASRIRSVQIQSLSGLTTQLGVVEAGEIRLGNGVLPGSGYSGLRMGYPGFTYDSEVWNFVGIENDIIQIGIRASDGKLLAGGGNVLLDEDGISFDISDALPQYEESTSIVWRNGAIPATDDTVFTVQGRFTTAPSSAFGYVQVDPNGDFANESILLLSAGVATDNKVGILFFAGIPSMLRDIHLSGTVVLQDIFTDTLHHYNFANENNDFRWDGSTNDFVLFLDAGDENITINGNKVSANYDLMLAGDGVLGLTETSTPTADTGYGKIYTKSDNNLYFQDGAGIEKVVGGAFTNLGSGSELTISGGSITPTESFHKIDTESDDATDNCDTIVPTTSGDILVLRAENNGRDVTFRDAVDNLNLAGDFTFTTTQDTLTLLCKGGNGWIEISRSDNS